MHRESAVGSSLLTHGFTVKLNYKEKYMKKFEGSLIASTMKVGIIVARFNEFIGSKLLSGVMDGL